MRNLIRRIGAVIAVTAAGGAAACSSTIGDPAAAPLSATASVRVDSSAYRSLIATVAVANHSTAAQAITWADDCRGNGAVDLRILRGATVLWSSAKVPSTPICPLHTVQNTIAAGDTARFEEQVLLADLMGDSIAAGTYAVTAAPIIASPSTASLESPIPVGSLLIADPLVVPLDTPLDGTWSGSTTGLAVSLSLHFTADTAFGSGSFSSPSPFAFPCAGGSIAGASGAATLVATRNGDVLFGRLMFDTGEGPPFTAHLRSADSLDLTLATVDTPSCNLSLRLR